MPRQVMHRTLEKYILLPVAVAALGFSFAGCGNKGADSAPDTSTPTASTPAPPPSAPSASPPGPTASAPGGPGGPGGTMMNTPSTNPSGAPGDAIITAKVKSALIADKKVGATTINVDTKSNVVVLRGAVPTAAGKAAAEADAKQTKGVSKVINQLTVNKA